MASAEIKPQFVEHHNVMTRAPLPCLKHPQSRLRISDEIELLLVCPVMQDPTKMTALHPNEIVRCGPTVERDRHVSRATTRIDPNGGIVNTDKIAWSVSSIEGLQSNRDLVRKADAGSPWNMQVRHRGGR
jgi:hypothetical protein